MSSIATASPLSARPFLKWAGGKGQLLAQYHGFYPTQYGRYFEPFLGGGAVFFDLGPRRAVLSDVNPELVNVYECVRDRVDRLIPLLQEHQRRHDREHYYRVRARVPRHRIQRAARLLYLNKTCFNGLYRENAKGQFNVPMGRYHNPRICDPDLLQAAAQALAGVEIHRRPFTEVVHQAQPGDFVYFDPPYFPLSPTSSFTAYSRYAFGEPEQIQLRDTFVHLAQRGVQVMLSNSDCPLIQDLYSSWPRHPIAATRAINSKADRRGKITELLITSY